MLRKLAGQPVWYKPWAAVVALAAVFVLLRWLLGSLEGIDYGLMALVNVSVLLDLCLGTPAGHHPAERSLD